MTLRKSVDGEQQMHLPLCVPDATARCRETCTEDCSAIRQSLLRMLGQQQEGNTVGNHQLQHMLRQHTLHQLKPLDAGLRSVPYQRNCCGGDGILVMNDRSETKTIVLADINGHGAKEQPSLHDLFAMIAKTNSDSATLGELLHRTNMAFSAWRDALDSQDAAHIPYAECAFIRLQEDGMLEAATAGGTTALVLGPNGTVTELCSEEAHGTWIGFPYVKKPVVPTASRLEREHTLVLCTDGIDPEIRTADSFWNSHKHAHPDGLANEIYRTFASGKDDATVLCLRR